jgi:hypothetical protein
MPITTNPTELLMICETAQRLCEQHNTPVIVVNENNPKKEYQSKIPYAVMVNMCDDFEFAHRYEGRVFEPRPKV